MCYSASGLPPAWDKTGDLLGLVMDGTVGSQADLPADET